MLAYQADAMREFLVQAIAEDARPAIASAIAKYHLTEMARKATNHAMDIHAGKGIQLGVKNYLADIYNAIPICITVEGANILTRNLIIFGQAALRAHPFLSKEVKLINDINDKGNQVNFDKLFFQHAFTIVSQLTRGFVDGLSAGCFIQSNLPPHLQYIQKQMSRLSTAFALYSELAFLYYGSKLKFHEALSARLGDVLSYLLMVAACVKYYSTHDFSKDELNIFKVSVNDLMFKAQSALEAIVLNFKPKTPARLLKNILFVYGMPIKPVTDDAKLNLAKTVTEEDFLRDLLSKDIYLSNDQQDACGLLENTYVKYNELCDVYEVIRQAVAKKQIDKKSNLIDQAHHCFDLNLITKDKLSQFVQLQKSIEELMHVDSFSNNTLTGEIYDETKRFTHEEK